MEPTKIYKQRFFINESQTDSIDIYWKSGLKHFEIKYQNQVIKEFSHSEQIQKGYEVFVPNLGNLKVKMHKEPFGFEVKIGHQFLTNSRIPAEAKLKPVANIFYFVGIMSFLPLLIYIIYIATQISLLNIPIEMALNMGIWLLISLIYFAAGHLLKKGYLWAYFMGLTVFTLISLIYLTYFFMDANIFIFFLLVLRLFFFVVMITHIKSMLDLHRHRKIISALKEKGKNKDILDTL